MQNNNLKTSRRKRKSRIDARAAYLLPYLSPLTYGKKTENGPRPKLTKFRANEYLARGWSGKISARKLVEHFSGKATHYYWADLTAESILLMGDVDCHDSGTAEGAMAFCKFLSETLFPELYYEPSTNGTGAHFYLDIRNLGLKLTRNDVSRLATRLANKFTELSKDFDVQMVEIKGHPPEVTHRKYQRVEHGYRVVSAEVLTYGQFAKLPRLSSFDKFEKFKNRPVLTPEEIESERFDVQSDVVEADESKTVRVAEGSCMWVTKDDQRILENLTAWCKAQELDNLKTSGRHVVTARDFAIAMLVVNKLTSVMKNDDSMRTIRIMGVWNSFYSAGVVDRAFDPKRWKVIRNTLSERGLLDWRDSSYVVPIEGEGRAMNWRLGQELLDVMSEMADCKDLEEATLLGTQEILIGKGDICYPRVHYGEVISMPLNWQKRLDEFVFPDWSSIAA